MDENSFFSKNKFILLVIISLFIISLPIQQSIDGRRNNFRSIDKVLYFNSDTLKILSLGYEELLADLYWLRVLQYFGNTTLDEQNPQKLYKYFDILTDLDPKFINAYRYGATFIGELPPYGLGDLESAMNLLNKGRNNNKKDYKLPLEQAFLYYLYTEDFESAAELFVESANNISSEVRKGSIMGMAANARLRGGNRKMAKKIWNYIYNTNQNEGRRNYALQNIKELNTMDREDELNEKVYMFFNNFNEFPNNMEEIIKAGYLQNYPYDHEGRKFIIARNINKVKSVSLANKKLEENIGYLNARVLRFKQDYGKYPENINELKKYINETALLRKFPEHPLGEQYIYNAETGEFDYDKSFLN